jgi:integrase
VVHDCGPNQSEDGTGWIEIFGAAKGAGAAKDEGRDASSAENEGGSDVSRAEKEGGLLLTINGKTGWREVEIGRGSSPLSCPVAMLETWMRLGRVADGPLFRRVTKKNAGVTSEHLTDKHVARLVQKAALAADIRGDLSEGERKLAFSCHSLRAGLASSAKIEEAHVQRHLGHASAEMTRRYRRKRDRFKVNLTRAAGL